MRGRSIRAGDLDRRITFKRLSGSENAFGEPATDSFELIASARASVNYGKASERREAGIEGTDLPATFCVRKSTVIATVTTKDVIEFEGATWGISSVVPFGDVGFDFTATRRSS